MLLCIYNKDGYKETVVENLLSFSKYLINNSIFSKFQIMKDFFGTCSVGNMLQTENENCFKDPFPKFQSLFNCKFACKQITFSYSNYSTCRRFNCMELQITRAFNHFGFDWKRYIAKSHYKYIRCTYFLFASFCLMLFAKLCFYN